MKKIKKPVSLLLSMILIFSLFTIIPVSAAETGQTRALCCVCPAVLYLDFAVFFFVLFYRVANQNEDLTISGTSFIIRDNVQLVQHFFINTNG